MMNKLKVLLPMGLLVACPLFGDDQVQATSVEESDAVIQTSDWTDDLRPYGEARFLMGKPKSDGEGLKFKPGLAIEAGVHAFDDFRFGFEFNLTQCKGDKGTLEKDGKEYQDVELKGHMMNFMLNAYYDYEIESDFEVFAGIGAGLSVSSVEAKGTEKNTIGKTKVRDYDKTGLGLQGMLGAAFNITENFNINARLRYMHVFSKGRLFSVDLGLRYSM